MANVVKKILYSPFVQISKLAHVTMTVCQMNTFSSCICII